jgi:hypothetical protein
MYRLSFAGQYLYSSISVVSYVNLVFSTGNSRRTLEFTLGGTFLSDYGHHFSVRTEFLNPVIAGVGHPDASCIIQRHSLRHIEPAWLFPDVTEAPYELQVCPKDFDAAVFAVQRQNFSLSGHCAGRREPELIVSVAEVSQYCNRIVPLKNLDAMISRVSHQDPSGAVYEHPLRSCEGTANGPDAAYNALHGPLAIKDLDTAVIGIHDVDKAAAINREPFGEVQTPFLGPRPSEGGDLSV